MTEYFEVRDRDGPARLGQLRLATPVTTPTILEEDRIEDAGSLWVRDRELPEGGEDVLTVLPHRGFPGGTPTDVQETFAVEHPEVSYPSAAVIGTETAGEHGTDAYVLSDARSAVGHAEAFVDTICRVREAIPADTALYLPGVATPANVGLLAYAGVDLVDPHRAVLEGLEGKYLTADGERVLEDLEERPCACPACRGDGFDRDACAEHNEYALESALATVRERIRTGRLRDYLEGQVRHERWLTAALGRFDEQHGYLEERTPVCRQAEITATSEDTLRRVEIRRYADRVTTRYRPRFEGPPVLVPCSATNPDSGSPSHAQFHDAIGYRGHTVSLTAPIGVVPQELKLTYPAQHYNAAVTGSWSPTEIEFVADVLATYLEGAAYDRERVIAHVPEEYRPVCERARELLEADLPFEYTVVDHPTTEASLSALSEALAGEATYSKRERQHATLRAIADYQFGREAGDELFPDPTVEGRYPKLRALESRGGAQLAALVPEYGLLALTLAGARRWAQSSVPVQRVEIDEFVPHSSVLAPGVVEASETIRPGEEVLIEGPRALAVGRARMSGPEMVESTRGVASSVRHVEER